MVEYGETQALARVKADKWLKRLASACVYVYVRIALRRLGLADSLGSRLVYC